MQAEGGYVPTRMKLCLAILMVFLASTLAAACGSGDESTFDPTADAGTSDDATVGPGGDAAFVGPEGGIGNTTCIPRTCQQLDVGCGPAGDGCGNLIQCGT